MFNGLGFKSPKGQQAIDTKLSWVLYLYISLCLCVLLSSLVNISPSVSVCLSRKHLSSWLFSLNPILAPQPNSAKPRARSGQTKSNSLNLFISCYPNHQLAACSDSSPNSWPCWWNCFSYRPPLTYNHICCFIITLFDTSFVFFSNICIMFSVGDMHRAILLAFPVYVG